MKNLITFTSILALILSFTACKNNIGNTEPISFYEVPLVCGAAPEIGCGSRIKPFFLDTEKDHNVKESWSNREGTIIAIVWNESFNGDRKNLLQPIFKKHAIDATLITDKGKIDELTASMKKDKWYKGMDVDQLSLEEAGVIAEDLTRFAFTKGLINDSERQNIKNDLEGYFKKELVIVRTCDELKSEETQEKWRKDGYQIYVTHIGKDRADSVASFFSEYQSMKKEKCEKDGKKPCCDKDEESCSEKHDDGKSN